MRRTGATLGAGIAGLVAGAVLTLALQGAAMAPRKQGFVPERHIERRPDPHATVLAWVPGRMPAGFEKAARSLSAVDDVAVVRSGTAWLTSSRSADGAIVDRAPHGRAYPLETAGVSPLEYRPFLPPGEQDVLADLAHGEVALGETSSALRHLGPGATLHFGHKSVKVAAVLPDELVGAHEVLASRRTASRLGVTRSRYALVDPEPGTRARRLASSLRRLTDMPIQIRMPGETPFFRQGDAVLPPVALKELFGEFAARPVAGGGLAVDRQWRKRYIVKRNIPIVGRTTCNREVIPQLVGAMRQIRREGLAHLIDPGDYGGCYSPRFINRNPDLGISHHTWGVAVDLNVSENPFGHAPHQDQGIVKAFADWGFTWGGRWIVPDGMHFEYRQSPPNPK